MTPKRYTVKRIPKSNGKFRQIEIPDDQLKMEQRDLLPLLNALQAKAVPFAHGFRPGRSIVSNARVHKKGKYFVQLDIKDFFPSCTVRMVERALAAAGLEEARAREVAYICSYGNRLPQGAPTSPALANICAAKMDANLRLYATKNGMKYTRYADDITFSSEQEIDIPELLSVVNVVARKNGFKLNYEKTRSHRPGGRHLVTGVILTPEGKLSIPREYRRRLRARVHQYKLGTNPEGEQVLRGCVAFIKGVNRKQGTKFEKMLARGGV